MIISHRLVAMPSNIALGCSVAADLNAPELRLKYHEKGCHSAALKSFNATLHDR